jgi:hypothetical protein
MSCNSDEKQNTEQFETNKKKVIDSLVSKYNIIYSWDTLGFQIINNYSINYKPIIDSKYQLIDNIEISDIYEKGSVEYVSIKTGYYPSFYFDFPITKEQEKKLVQTDGDLIIVVSIAQLRKIKLSIEGEIEDEGTTVNLANSNDFIGKGKIIDILSIKKQTKDSGK